MSSKKNPKLKAGDRVILIYMPDENIDTGTKGKVKSIGQQPSFGGSSDYMYNMEWYDDDDEVISTLSLIPNTDSWILDPEFSQNLQESRFTELDDLIKHHEWSKLFKKSDLSYVLEFLEVIRQLGVVNMFESGQFLGQTEQYLTKYFDLYRMKRDLDDDDEELIQKIIDMGENVRNIMISAVITDLEQKNQEITERSATNRFNRLAGEILRWFMKSYS